MDDDILSIISDQLGMHVGSSLTTPYHLNLRLTLLPSTPQGQKKKKKKTRQKLVKDPANAGRLAVHLATEDFFNEEILVESSLTGDHGKLKILDPERIYSQHRRYCHEDVQRKSARPQGDVG